MEAKLEPRRGQRRINFWPAVLALMERRAGAGVYWLSFPFKPVRAPRSAQVHLAAQHALGRPSLFATAVCPECRGINSKTVSCKHILSWVFLRRLKARSVATS